MVDVQRSRFFLREKANLNMVRYAPKASRRQPTHAPPMAAARSSKWRLEDSIWAGRKQWAESRDYWDTSEVVEKAITHDWRKAVAHNKLDAFLLKHDAGAPDPKLCTREVRAAFLDEVEQVVLSHGRMLLQVFDYYASLGVTDDLFHIYQLGYRALISDCGLAVDGSRVCDINSYDIIFLLANMPDAQVTLALALTHTHTLALTLTHHPSPSPSPLALTLALTHTHTHTLHPHPSPYRRWQGRPRHHRRLARARAPHREVSRNGRLERPEAHQGRLGK